MQMTPSTNCTQGFPKIELDGDFESATMGFSFYLIGCGAGPSAGGTNFRDRQQNH
jgi:hypothetical protein